MAWKKTAKRAASAKLVRPGASRMNTLKGAVVAASIPLALAGMPAVNAFAAQANGSGQAQASQAASGDASTQATSGDAQASGAQGSDAAQTSNAQSAQTLAQATGLEQLQTPTAQPAASETDLLPTTDVANGATKLSDEGDGTKNSLTPTQGNVTIIVQLDGSNPGLDPLTSLFSNTAENRHEHVKDEIKNLVAQQPSVTSADGTEEPATFQEIHDYYHAIDGFAIKVPANLLDQIKQLPSVKHAFVEQMYSIPADQGEQPALKNQSSLDMTAADKVSETGKGQVIAVIDSGLDTDHEAFKGDLDDASTAVKGDEDVKQLGHGAYISEKIPYVRDYADGDDDVHPSAVSGMEHGTHVSGIAAANSGDEIRGTAPDAQLMMLKVAADANGGIYDSAMLAALDDATALKVDSVNMSLGSDAGFADNPTYEDALNALRKTGATINVAAGNSTTAALGNKSGQSLPYASDPDSAIISSPAADENSFAVASIDNSERSPFFTASDGTKIAYLNASMIDNSDAPQFSSLKDGDYEYVDAGQGSDNDVASLQGQYPTGLAGKIALVQRGGTNADGSNTTFAQKVNNMAKLGVSAVIIYDNADGNPSRFGVDNKAIPCIMITKANGEVLKNAETKTITVKQGVTMEPSTAYTMSSYSSWGVTPDLKLKPEITAPGGNIWSSVPGNKYEYMSGTSMATPQMAGISAQLHQYIDGDAKFKGLSDAEKSDVVTQLLMSTAEPVADPAVDDGAFYSPRWQGAGLTNVQAATSSPAYLTVDGATDASRPKADLGDSADGSWSFTLEVHNLSDKDANYKADAQALSEQVENNLFRMHETNWTGKGIDVAFSGDAAADGSVTVKAKGTAKVTVTVTAGQAFKDWASANTPNGAFVEGFVQLKAADDGGVNLSAPYLGFYGNWGSVPVFDAALWDSSNVHIYGTTLASPNSGQTLGINPLTDTTAGVDASKIDPSKLVVSRTQYSTSPNGAYPLTGTLRNVQNMSYDWKNADGTVVKHADLDHLSKSRYNAQSGQVFYAEASVTTDTQSKAAFDGKDTNGTSLPDGTYTLTQTATTAGGDATQQQNKVYDGLTVQYDTTAPKVTNMKLSGEGDDQTVSFDVSDKSYIAGIQLNTPSVGGYFYRQLDTDAVLKDVQPTTAEDGTKTWHITLKVADIKAAWDSTQTALGTKDPLPNAVPLIVWDYGLNPSTSSQAVLNPVPATGVTLSSDAVTLAAGEAGKLDAKIAPEDTTQNELTWTSSDEGVVTVDDSGNLRGVANGSATVTVAVAANPAIKAEAKITVANVTAETGIVMADSSANVEPNGTANVSAIVAPELADKDVTWTSSDDSIASVKADDKDSTKAVVTGGSQIGDATITATVDGKSATMKIAVRPADYGDFEIDANGKLTVYKGNAQHVVIPNNVKEIGASAFQACPMVDVFVPASVEKIDDHAFASAGNLTTVTFEEGSKLTEVGEGAFYYTLSLDTVNLPDSVTKMGGGVFEQSTIRHARMAGMTEIPGSTFSGSPQIADLTISDDVTAIGDNAFSASQGLGEFKIAHKQGDGSFKVDDGASVLPSKLETIGNSAFSGTQFKSLDLPSGVKTIGDHAFALLGGTVQMNEGLTSVGAYGLAGTQNTEFVLPSTLTDVGYGAFSQNGSLKSVTLGKHVKADQLAAAFAYSNALSEFKLPEGGTDNYDVVNKALYNKDKTQLVAYPLALTGDGGVYTIADGTTDVAEYAFAHAYFLSEVKFPEGLKTVGDSAFVEDKLTKVELPSTMETVGHSAFQSNALLTSAKLGGTKELQTQAFAYSRGLVDLDFGTRLETIGDGAFTQVVGLKKLILPDTLKSLGSLSFANLPNLEEVHIGAGLTSSLEGAFTGDPKLSKLTVSPDNPVHSADHNVLYSKISGDAVDDTHLAGLHLVLSLPTNTFEEYTVKDGTVQIDSQAFRSNANLKKINLPEGLKRISTSAFNGVPLDDSEVVFPDSLETMNDSLAKIGTAYFGSNLKGDMKQGAGHLVIAGGTNVHFADSQFNKDAETSYFGAGVTSVSYDQSAPTVIVADNGLTSFSITGLAFQNSSGDGGKAEDRVNALQVYVPAGSDSEAVIEKSLRETFANMMNQSFAWAGQLPKDFDVDGWVSSHIHTDYMPLTLGLYAEGDATPGAKLSVTAASTGGIADGKQYRFVEVAADGSEKVVQDWGDSNTLEWTVPEGGSADSLHAEVRDASYLKVSADKVQQGTPAVDNSALVKAIDAAKAIEQGNKTDEAWKTFQDAITAAQAVADNKDATQQQVNDAYAALNKAVSDFKSSADKPAGPIATLPGTTDAEAVSVEAEAGTLVNDASNDGGYPLTIAKSDSASGGAYVDALNKGDYVTYRLNAPVAGTYHVTVTYQSGDGLNNLDYSSVEDGVVEPGSAAANVAGLDKWSTLEFDMKVTKAGDFTLKLAGGENNGPRLDKLAFALKEASEQPTPGDGKLQDGHTYEVPLKLDASQQYESYFHNYTGAFDGVKPATVKYENGKYTVVITLGNGGAISQLTYGADKTPAKQLSNDGSVSTWQLELDTLDEVTIEMGNGIFGVSGPLGFDVDNAKDTTPDKPVTADKTALNDAIAAAEKLNADDYEQTSWGVFSKALEAARKVAADDNATQQQVDDAAKALTDAQKALVSKPAPKPVDKTALKKAVDAAAEVKDLDNYTNSDEEKDTFRKALADAQTLVEKKDATQEEVDAAAEALADAQAKLTLKGADFTKLQEAVDAAKALDLTGYQDGPEKGAFTKALEAAKAVLADTKLTILDQQKVDDATTALTDAQKALKAVVNKDKLTTAIDAAEKLVLDDYKDGAEKDAFTKALVAAKALVDNTDATQDQVDAAAKALTDAQANLKLKDVDKRDLRSAVEAAREVAKKLDNYVDGDAKDAFTDAMKTAETLLADNSLTFEDQQQVNDATKALEDAQAALTLKPLKDAQKQALQQAADDAAKVDLGNYQDGKEKDAFNAALKAVNDLLANGTIEDADKVREALDALAQARAALVGVVKPANTDALKAAVDKANALDLSKYTDDSAAAVTNALKTAQALLDNPSLDITDQATIDAATSALTGATDKLVEKGQQPGGDNKPGDNGGSQQPGGNNGNGGAGNQGGSGNNGSGTNAGTTKPGGTSTTTGSGAASTKKLPQTSDPTVVSAVAGTGIIGSIAAMLGIHLRRRK